MSKPIPQYARTTDPRVLEAVRRNRVGAADFHNRACEFAVANGVEKGSYYPGGFGGGRSIRALGGNEKPRTGRWTTGYGGYGWRPFKNNPLHDEMDAIRFEAEPVPGLPSLVNGPYLPNGSHTIATPQPFELDGAVYVGFSFQPVDSGRRMPDPGEGGWEEIKASEYHAAVETYNDRIKETD